MMKDLMFAASNTLKESWKRFQKSSFLLTSGLKEQEEARMLMVAENKMAESVIKRCQEIQINLKVNKRLLVLQRIYSDVLGERCCCLR